VPLGAGAADVGATDFARTSEPDMLMVLSPPVGFALAESVTWATVNDPPSTPDDNAGQVVIPSQKSVSGPRDETLKGVQDYCRDDTPGIGTKILHRGQG